MVSSRALNMSALLLTGALLITTSQTVAPKEPARPNIPTLQNPAGPSEGGPEAHEICSCWCWCVSDPTTRTCHGDGYCCIGEDFMVSWRLEQQMRL